ncbi:MULTISPECIES: MazG nucleotide pyrophosphohydrolase domain-containing protein [unclassified Beijerinckia]|uniref:MazG nucleotide pyrophosphohydrolase domain-containing protein n=1 Tax=unclassified Beijerinckia TaxID=2638183 RepID=UPI00089B0BE1|nr:MULTISPECIES: MazG nucleotide pyrophosphohydrolase domain-containing protein [unclassified Beijerinckia]MDH7796453.1 hypothetical protein [Beijerinckia sp. GAS462]SEC45746.1 MazG nucleotide pyrophosphohydrolase domain-containing protein [Beijerinckia sp. 28-YEA-48]
MEEVVVMKAQQTGKMAELQRVLDEKGNQIMVSLPEGALRLSRQYPISTDINVDGENYADFVRPLAKYEKFHEELSHPTLLAWTFDDFAREGRNLDSVKKALFYGRDTENGAEVESMKFDEPGVRFDVVDLDILHGIIGVCTEAAELGELLSTALYNQKEIDENELLLETGDLLWYLQLLCNAQGGITRVTRGNMEKLKKRFPNAVFTEKAALERADMHEDR